MAAFGTRRSRVAGTIAPGGLLGPGTGTTAVAVGLGVAVLLVAASLTAMCRGVPSSRSGSATFSRHVSSGG